MIDVNAWDDRSVGIGLQIEWGDFECPAPKFPEDEEEKILYDAGENALDLLELEDYQAQIEWEREMGLDEEGNPLYV